MRDEVVKLPRDPGALLSHGIAGAQLLLTLERLGARGQRFRTGGERLGAKLPVAHRAAGDQHGDDRHHRELHAVAELPVGAQLGNEARDRDDRAADDEAARVGPDGQRVPVAEERDAERGARLWRGHNQQRGKGDRQERGHGQRVAPAEGHRCGDEDGHRHGERLGAGDRIGQPQLELGEHHEPGGNQAIQALFSRKALHESNLTRKAPLFLCRAGELGGAKIPRTA